MQMWPGGGRRLAGSGQAAPARAGGSERTGASRSPRPPQRRAGHPRPERPLRASHPLPLGTAHRGMSSEQPCGLPGELKEGPKRNSQCKRYLPYFL